MATVDAARDKLEVYLLDMGREKYGDSILCRLGNRSILIDGGHPRDIKDRGENGEYKSIPNQLAGIFGHAAPFDISLLVVTHCHNDHIGCLPELVEQKIIKPKWALVADLNLGFGIPRDGDDGDNVLDAPDISPAMRRVIAALREENQSDLSDAQLQEFIDAIEKLDVRYDRMCDSLAEELEDQFVRFGVDDHDALVDEFADFGLQVLGPTQDHLLICAESIRQAVDALVDDLKDVVADGEFTDGADLNDVAVYRALAGPPGAESADGGRPGFALNDQSIILLVEVGADKKCC